MLKRLERILEWILFLLIPILLLASDSPAAETTFDRARAFTRPYEFNYDIWTIDAAWVKIQQTALGSARLLSTRRPDRSRHGIPAPDRIHPAG